MILHFLEIKCGPNEVYNPRRLKFCQNKIINFFAKATCDNFAVDEGCECIPGYVRDDDDNCVPLKEAEKACVVNIGCGKKPVTLKVCYYIHTIICVFVRGCCYIIIQHNHYPHHHPHHLPSTGLLSHRCLSHILITLHMQLSFHAFIKIFI